MRGNLDRTKKIKAAVRSIPAYAGEPVGVRLACQVVKVYPRVCGGTSRITLTAGFPYGLSPRMRGNRAQSVYRRVRRRSIPAYAGEPSYPCRKVGIKRVYPRVCGGTLPGRGSAGLRGGLSPRMRGNRRTPGGCLRRAGSIPAYAGEPLPGAGERGVNGVYPRVCGGTHRSGGYRPAI